MRYNHSESVWERISNVRWYGDIVCGANMKHQYGYEATKGTGRYITSGNSVHKNPFKMRRLLNNQAVEEYQFRHSYIFQLPVGIRSMRLN